MAKKPKSQKKIKETACTKFIPLKNKDTLTYDDISEMVEHLVNTNAYKHKIDYLEPEDIAQEIRLKCFNMLNGWDKNKIKGNPVWWFGVAVSNYIKNLYRNYSIKCPTFNKETRTTKVMQQIDPNSLLTEYNQDFDITNDEILSLLSKGGKEAYNKLLDTGEAKGIQKKYLREIRQATLKVVGYSLIDLYDLENFDD